MSPDSTLTEGRPPFFSGKGEQHAKHAALLAMTNRPFVWSGSFILNRRMPGYEPVGASRRVLPA